MTIYVLKRDNKRQLFDAHKINQWAKWADVSGEYWSGVVLQLKGRIRDGIATDDIQNNLIQICIDEEPKLPQVAARLLMGKIYKELELNGVNKHDFVSAVDTLNSLGMWEYSSLDQDELETLGKAIDHSKDLTYSYASVRQFYDKYALKVDGKVVETPQIAFMGIAIKLMAGSPVEEIIKFYQLLSDQVLNLPTPTLNGARTPLQPSPSCVVISGGDTIDSIGSALHSAYTYTAARGGIGIEFSVRAEGEPVKGGRVAHSGKNSIYRHTLASVNTLTQVTRGGSACVTYTCLDPEVEDLLTLKMQRTADSYRIDHLDYSLSVNNAFLRCVARNEPWLLASVRYAPKLHEAYYSGCEETFDKEYMNVWDEYLTEGTDLNKYGKVVSAREVILKFISARAETGRNYLHFVDNANKYKPFIDEDKVRLSNLCVVGSTKILTKEYGQIPIEDVVGKKLHVWNGQEWSLVDIIQTGSDRPVVTVTTDSGNSLTCTPEHRWFIKNHYHKDAEEVRTHELEVGDKLIKYDLPIIGNHKDFVPEDKLKFMYTNGFYSGDGCENKGNNIVYLYGEKMPLKNEIVVDRWYENPHTDENRLVGFSKKLLPKFFVPNTTFHIKERLAWLAGILDADGSVHRNNGNHQLVLSSINEGFLLETQLMLQTLGVDAKVRQSIDEGVRKLPMNDGSGDVGDFFCQTGYRLIINSVDTSLLGELGIPLKRLDISGRCEPNRSAKRFVRVVSVVDAGRADTFCFKEPKKGMGMFNGILTGQCQEISLPTEPYKSVWGLNDVNADGETALCFLSAIKAKDYTLEEHIEVAYYLLKSVDNVIDSTYYPFKQVELTARKRRAVGIGVTNFAHLMASKGLFYNTQMGRNFIHEWFEQHKYAILVASNRLAKERGRVQAATKYHEGWLPINNYAKSVDEHHTAKLLMDWDKLAKDIEKWGVRFSTHTALMPTESSSVFSDSTAGVYPVRSLEVYKQSRRGSVYFSVPEMDKLGDFYHLAWDIPTSDMVVAYAIMQKFTDQGISADFFHDFGKEDSVSASQMIKDILLSAKLGLKSWYYLNFKVGVSRNTGRVMQAVSTTSIPTEVEDDGSGCVECRM